MTRSTNMEHVEVLERLRGVLEHGKMGDKCLIAPDLVTAAIASLSAPQPPAEAHCTTCSCVPGMTPAVRFDATPAEKDGAVRDHLIHMGWTPPSEAQPEPNWCRTCGRRPHDPVAALCPDAHHRKASPPSAPVGVEEILAEMHEEGQADIVDGGIVLEWVDNLRNALAQQPSAAPVGVDGWVVETVEDDPNLLVINTPNKRSWIAQRGDRVFELAEALALAQQPRTTMTYTAGPEETHVRPLAPPAQQPASVDGDNPYPAPRNRQEAAALAKLALAYLGVTSAHIDAVVARCETDLAAQQGGSDNDR